MIKSKINKLIPFSSVDGPGNRFAVFLQGCNFNCGYCHNPETINHCINCKECILACNFGALSFENDKVSWNKEKCTACDECIKTCTHNSSPKILELYPSEVMEEIDKSIPFIRGVTVSGGECTLQLEFLYELFKLCKKKNLTCFIDTNGSIPLWENEEIFNLVDGVMLDVKSFSNEEHVNITNMENKTVLRNLEYLLSINKLYEVRTVIVEGLFNCIETVENVSKIITNSEVIYKLIKYRPIGVRHKFKEKWSEIPSKEFMDKLKYISEINNVSKVMII